MKEVKWILYTLYVVGYTSLAWTTIIWDWIKVGPDDIWISAASFSFYILTTINISATIIYLCINWDEK